MPLDLDRYDVAVALPGLDAEKALEAGEGEGYDLHRVTVLHADQLVSEQTSHRFGIGKMTANPITYATLWCWHALQRQGFDVGDWPTFKQRVLSVEKVDDRPEGSPVDPTTPDPDTDWP